MHVGAPHWEKRESPGKPRGEVRKVVNLHAGDSEKKPLWEYEQRVWKGLHWIYADGHDQHYPSWPEDEIKEGEEVKTRRELYQASFLAPEPGATPRASPSAAGRDCRRTRGTGSA